MYLHGLFFIGDDFILFLSCFNSSWEQHDVQQNKEAYKPAPGTPLTGPERHL